MVKSPKEPPSDQVVQALQELLLQHQDKRIVVVGTTCTGKSTLLSQIPGARDQDAELFPLLTQQESDYVCQTPWTKEIGATMTKLVRERVKSVAGKPVFGTVVIDADLIILLEISDSLLQKRVLARNSSFSDAKNMQANLELQVRSAQTPHIKFPVG